MGNNNIIYNEYILTSFNDVAGTDNLHKFDNWFISNTLSSNDTKIVIDPNNPIKAVKPILNPNNNCDCFHNYPYLRKNDYIIYGIDNVVDIIIPCTTMIDRKQYLLQIKNKLKILSGIDETNYNNYTYIVNNKTIKVPETKINKFKYFVYFNNKSNDTSKTLYKYEIVIHITKGENDSTTVEYLDEYNESFINISGNLYINTTSEQIISEESLACVGAFDENIYKTLETISTYGDNRLQDYCNNTKNKGFENRNQMRTILPYVSFCEALSYHEILNIGTQWTLINMAFYIASTLHMVRALRPSLGVSTVCGVLISNKFIGLIKKNLIQITYDSDVIRIGYDIFNDPNKIIYISANIKSDTSITISNESSNNIDTNALNLLYFISMCIISLLDTNKSSYRPYQIGSTKQSKNIPDNTNLDTSKAVWINALVNINKENKEFEYILIEKPESKSRVTYYLTSLTEEQKNILNLNENKMVDAQIIVIEEKSPWNKIAILLNIKTETYKSPLNRLFEPLINTTLSIKDESSISIFIDLLKTWFNMTDKKTNTAPSRIMIIQRAPIKDKDIILGRIENSMTDAIYLLIVSSFLAACRYANNDVNIYDVFMRPTFSTLIYLIVNNKNKLMILKNNIIVNYDNKKKTLVSIDSNVANKYNIDQSEDSSPKCYAIDDEDVETLCSKINNILSENLNSVPTDISMNFIPFSFLKICQVGYFFNRHDRNNPTESIVYILRYNQQQTGITTRSSYASYTKTSLRLVNCVKSGIYAEEYKKYNCFEGAIFNYDLFDLYCNSITFPFTNETNSLEIKRYLYKVAQCDGDKNVIKKFPDITDANKDPFKLINTTIYYSSFDYEWHNEIKMNSSHLSGNAIDIIGIKYKLLSNQVNEKNEKPYFETLIIFDVDINEKLFVFDKQTDKYDNFLDKNNYAWKTNVNDNNLIKNICEKKLFKKDDDFCNSFNSLLYTNYKNDITKIKEIQIKHYILSNPTTNQCVFILSPLMMYHFDYKDGQNNEYYYPLTLYYGSKFIKASLQSISDRVESTYDYNKNKYGGLYQHFMFCERFPNGIPKVLNSNYLQYSNKSFLFDDIFQTSIEVKAEKGKTHNEYVSITGNKDKNDVDNKKTLCGYFNNKTNTLITKFSLFEMTKEVKSDATDIYIGKEIINVYLGFYGNKIWNDVLRQKSVHHWDHIHSGVTDLS